MLPEDDGIAKANFPPPAQVVLYGRRNCPAVPRVRSMLKRGNVAFDYVNIHEDPEARIKVRAINDGFESVPTLVFPDGSTLTEPTTAALKEHLEGLGYTVPLPTWWQALTQDLVTLILGGVMIIYGLAVGTYWLSAIGVLLIAGATLQARYR